MPLLFNYLKIPNCFTASNASLSKNWMSIQRISVNLTNDCGDGNQINWN